MTKLHEVTLRGVYRNQRLVARYKGNGKTWELEIEIGKGSKMLSRIFVLGRRNNKPCWTIVQEYARRMLNPARDEPAKEPVPTRDRSAPAPELRVVG